jgi:hypothetical protein
VPPGNFLDDYVPVNERIDKWYKEYPNGRITTEIVRMVEDQVVVKAFCYRDDESERPAGVGHSQMTIPGRNVARGAELETTETSAVGRALANAGQLVHRSVASREEVIKNTHDDDPTSGVVNITPSSVANIERGGRSNEVTDAQLNAIRAIAMRGGIGSYQMTKHIADALGDELVLDENPGTAATELREYLSALEANDAGRLIAHLDNVTNPES